MASRAVATNHRNAQLEFGVDADQRNATRAKEARNTREVDTRCA